MGSHLIQQLKVLAAILFGLAALGAWAGHARANDTIANHVHADCRSTGADYHDLSTMHENCRNPAGVKGARDRTLRFDISKIPAGQMPQYLVSRTARFDAITMTVVDGEGGPRTRTTAFDAIKATFFDRQFAIALPEIGPGASAVIVRFEGLTQPGPVDYAHLRSNKPGSTEAERNKLLLIALLCGMMLMPLLFDAAFYRVLREPFILWHAAFVVAIVWQLSATFGLYLPLLDLTVPTMRAHQVGSFSAMAIIGVMFAVSFIEIEKLDRRLRRWLKRASAIFLFIAMLHIAAPEVLGSAPALLFYYSGGALGALVVVALVQALLRGSLAARFLAVGLGPLIVVALIRVITFAIPGVPTVDANALMLFATLMEAIATAMGVTHRFIAIRKERDHTRNENLMLEELTRRDPLTGLMNRRALMGSFDDLVDRGFHMCALIDVDRFKTINDEFGHGVGDTVLVEAAKALQPDDNTMVMRLGGEEFLILLRGPDAIGRAERRRKAITARIMKEVHGLGRPVTASMGVVDFTALANEGPVDFATVYSRADQLLYNAKECGRNRAEVEALSFFEAEPNGIRKQVA